MSLHITKGQVSIGSGNISSEGSSPNGEARERSGTTPTGGDDTIQP